MNLRKYRTYIVCGVVILIGLTLWACCKSIAPDAPQTMKGAFELMRLARASAVPPSSPPAKLSQPFSLMPPTNAVRAVTHPGPTNQIWVTLAWSNSLPVGADLNALSQSMVTGLYGSTNLYQWYLRESHPFALSNRVTLRMTNKEVFKAFNGPKSK